MAPDVSVPQECQVRASYKKECQERVPQECLTRVSSKSVLQECRRRSVKQECLARVSSQVRSVK